MASYRGLSWVVGSCGELCLAAGGCEQLWWSVADWTAMAVAGCGGLWWDVGGYGKLWQGFLKNDHCHLGNFRSLQLCLKPFYLIQCPHQRGELDLLILNCHPPLPHAFYNFTLFPWHTYIKYITYLVYYCLSLPLSR